MCGELIYADLLTQLWIETLLYGLYLSLFATSVYIYSRRGANKRALAMCIAMFIPATGELFMDLINILLVPRLISESYVDSGTIFACQDSPERTRQNNLYTRLNNISYIFFTTKLWLGDSIIVYRCWMVWASKRWVAMIPAFLLFTTMVVGYGQVGMSYQYYYAQLRAQASSLPSDRAEVIRLGLLLYDLNSVATATSVATNILVTGLIVYRIWSDTRELDKAFGGRVGQKYNTAIAMLIESGALYTASLLAELISNNFDGNAAYVANDMADAFTAYLVVIAPSLIIIRVGLNKGFVETRYNRSSSVTDPTNDSRPAHSVVFAPRSTIKSDAREATETTANSVAMLDFPVRTSSAREEMA